ncbi:PhnB protein [Advenella kashmirensis W13003]|uniref:PhnB protein n=1 Tax=Advenella kashmirensis W13003 TaxID=1424334 RepID=V8QUE4_9BURK|nr:VOC family protein [Advenella kashmirensis]ETF03541.1 PhnB protein [Advenella kashmirensis W13003]
MRVTLSPYLNFNGQCREALTLYQSCFGGELLFRTVAEFPADSPDCPTASADPDTIMHGQLVNQDFMILGTDMNNPAGFRPGNDFGFGVSIDSEENLHRSIEILASGGTLAVPPGPTPWADMFAVVADRFGKIWYLNYFGSKSPQSPSRSTQ